MEGKEGQFCIRENYSSVEQETVLWTDSTVYDYTERDEALENICMYEFVAKYKKEYTKFKQMGKDEKERASRLLQEADKNNGFDDDDTPKPCERKKILSRKIIPVLSSHTCVKESMK